MSQSKTLERYYRKGSRRSQVRRRDEAEARRLAQATATREALRSGPALQSLVGQDGQLYLVQNGKAFRADEVVLLQTQGPRPAGCEAWHKNGDPLDCHPDNLAWRLAVTAARPPLRLTLEERVVDGTVERNELDLVVYDEAATMTEDQWRTVHDASRVEMSGRAAEETADAGTD